ncbi:uncharacterized protein LOC130946558 [Arachis stenosperma]|uniref:uncharacterized protein LOC130946558 n=1 Tax=Arachis stenosperma TaxID=217475 RepID=UPI0025AD0B97|nr:uncharacterized protein LOC130946558 [Arachis stenosperma]
MFRMTTVIWSLTRWSMQKMILMSMIMVRRMRKNKEKRKKMERKEQLWKTKVDGIMMRWNNLRYKCPKSERERDVYDKFGYTYQNREQNNKYIGIHPRLKAKIKGVFVLQFNDKTILCCIIWQGVTLLTQS